jgi:hypothetical protein
MSGDEALRAASLANNIMWLRSFGSEVVEDDGRIEVLASPIAEYVSVVVLTAGALRHVAEQRAAKTMFIDDRLFAGGAADLLRRCGYERVAGIASVTVGGRVALRRRSPGAVSMVVSDDIDEWSKLYSEAFGRVGAEADVDRTRWRRASATGNVQHWTFMRGGGPIGVCQTIHAFGITGVYSVGVLSDARSPVAAFGVVRALQAVLRAHGWDAIYFETFGAWRSRRAARRLRLHVLRSLYAYAIA